MRNSIGLILLIIFIIPINVQGAEIDYALQVRIDTGQQKISGTADISADADTALILSVGNLYNVKVNGGAVARDLDHTVTLPLQKHRKTRVTYEAGVRQDASSFIDAAHVFLSGNWYPVPDALVTYHLSAVLPETFVAVAEADAIRSQSDDGNVTYWFHFNHPLDQLHLAASSRYVVFKDSYRDIALEAYFFKEDADHAATYLDHVKKYLKMYEDMLTPYPYARFAVVEHVLPAGYSMPTFTLLGQEVLRLPFIVHTSLGHEILHQWFGNSVYIDLAKGNWAEGLTTYLSDHHLAVLDNQGKEYRKQILVDYAAYVKPDTALAVGSFYYRSDKAHSVVGYGKSAMIFHDLRKRFGDRYFFAALQEFIHGKRFAKASWSDIQTSFEKVTGRNLSAYFDRWLSGTDIPDIRVEDAALTAENGEMTIDFTLRQQSPPYPLRLPVSVYFEKGARIYFIEMDSPEKKVQLPVHDLPLRVIADEGYDVIRQLTPEETPPSLAMIMGSPALTVVAAAQDRSTYQPLLDALGVSHQVTWLSPEDADLPALKDRNLLIAGYDSDLVKTLAGNIEIPNAGVHLNVINNPYDTSHQILIAHVSHVDEALAIQRKLRHYGKYAELIFTQGRVTHKQVGPAKNGITILSHQAPKAVKPSELPTLDRIIPELAAHRVIYIGERHDQFAHHINQLLVIKKLHERGVKLAVGMEMFKKPFQQVIDDYLAGKMDERQFLQASHYFSEWGYNYHLYKPIIDYLKQNDIPLLALNLEGGITSRVAREGLDGLKADDRKSLPEALDFTNKQYRDHLKEVFALHGDQEEIDEFDYFLQAQVLWDESMADAAHTFLRSAPGRTLVVLAGNGHLKYKYGIPDRLFRRNQEPFVVVLQDEAIEDRIADYVLISEKLSVKDAPKLGVGVKEKKNGLKINSILDNSPAKNAGLQKGDVIQGFDVHPIATLYDLRLALFYAASGKTYDMTVLRDNKKILMKIKLFD